MMWCLCHNWRKFNSSQNARLENTFHLLAYHKYYHRSSRGSLLATLYYIAQINLFPSPTFLRCPPSTYHNIINFLRHPMASHRFFPMLNRNRIHFLRKTFLTLPADDKIFRSGASGRCVATESLILLG